MTGRFGLAKLCELAIGASDTDGILEAITSMDRHNLGRVLLFSGQMWEAAFLPWNADVWSWENGADCLVWKSLSPRHSIQMAALHALGVDHDFIEYVANPWMWDKPEYEEAEYG